MLRFAVEQVVWQEVPGEVSLAFTISGCPLRCKGCHSSEFRDPKAGQLLTVDYFLARLTQYQGLISCVLFLGGEWLHEELVVFLRIACEQHLKTCLYTGSESIDPNLLPYLTYLKTGPWVAELGGIDDHKTNQCFINVKTQENLNYKFLKNHNKKGATYVTSQPRPT